jgi:hypothetical protein
VSLTECLLRCRTHDGGPDRWRGAVGGIILANLCRHSDIVLGYRQSPRAIKRFPAFRSDTGNRMRIITMRRIAADDAGLRCRQGQPLPSSRGRTSLPRRKGRFAPKAWRCAQSVDHLSLVQIPCFTGINREICRKRPYLTLRRPCKALVLRGFFGKFPKTITGKIFRGIREFIRRYQGLRKRTGNAQLRS